MAIPKFQPAPRMPQNSSGSSVSLARTNRPSAVTSSTARRLSIVSPKWRCSRPTPPPSVSPATPVWPIDAGRADEAMRLGGDVELAEERAAVDPRHARRRVDGHAAHPRHVDDEAAVTARVTRRRCGRRTGTASARSCSRANRMAVATSVALARPDDDGRSAVVERVPQPARLVVGVVGRRDDLAAERSAQLIEVAGSTCRPAGCLPCVRPSSPMRRRPSPSCRRT